MAFRNPAHGAFPPAPEARRRGPLGSRTRMKAFFDIDTQIDFVSPTGALYGPGAERVVPAVAALNRYAGAHGIPLISTMCAHPVDAREFQVWPPHCIVGTAGQQKAPATL